MGFARWARLGSAGGVVVFAGGLCIELEASPSLLQPGARRDPGLQLAVRGEGRMGVGGNALEGSPPLRIFVCVCVCGGEALWHNNVAMHALRMLEPTCACHSSLGGSLGLCVCVCVAHLTPPSPDFGLFVTSGGLLALSSFPKSG